MDLIPSLHLTQIRVSGDKEAIAQDEGRDII